MQGAGSTAWAALHAALCVGPALLPHAVGLVLRTCSDPQGCAPCPATTDVESHFKRFERDVTQHLLPPSEEEAAAQAAAAEAAAAAAKAAEEAAAAAARRSPVRRLGSAAAGVAGAAARHLTPGLAVRAGGLLALQRVHPGAARAASAVSVAVPLASAAAMRAGLPLGATLPHALQAAGRELGQFGQAAVALAVGRMLLAALRQHQRRRRQRRSQGQGAAGAEQQVPVAVGQPVATPGGRLLRRKSSVNRELLSWLAAVPCWSASSRLQSAVHAANACKEWPADPAAQQHAVIIPLLLTTLLPPCSPCRSGGAGGRRRPVRHHPPAQPAERG